MLSECVLLLVMLTNESDYPDAVGGTAIATSGGVVMRPEYGRCKIRRYPLQPRKVLHPPRKLTILSTAGIVLDPSQGLSCPVTHNSKN
jgi:hypothetical protein